MTQEEALLEALFEAAELGGADALRSVALDDDTLHRITQAVVEDLIERGELDAPAGA